MRQSVQPDRCSNFRSLESFLALLKLDAVRESKKYLFIIAYIFFSSGQNAIAKDLTTEERRSELLNPDCYCEDELYTDSLTTAVYKVQLPDPKLCERDYAIQNENLNNINLKLSSTMREMSDTWARKVKKQIGNDKNALLPPTFRASLSQYYKIEPPPSFSKIAERDQNGIVFSKLPEAKTLPSDCYIHSLNRAPSVSRRRCTNSITHPNLKAGPNAFDYDAYFPPIPSCQIRKVDQQRESSRLVKNTICPNNKYVQLVKDAFEETMSCLGVDPREIFPIINHESQFRLNALSQSGAACIGQVIPASIEFASRDKSYLKEMEIKCPKVRNLFEEVDVKFFGTGKADYNDFNVFGTPNKCKVIENPYTCLVYTALIYRQKAEYFAKLTQTSAKGKNYFQRPSEVNSLLVHWSYNGGSGGIERPFKDLLEDLASFKQTGKPSERLKGYLAITNKSVSEIATEMRKNTGLRTESFKKIFTEYLRNEYDAVPSDPKKAAERRNEVATYLDKIDRDLKDLYKQMADYQVAGVKCH